MLLLFVLGFVLWSIHRRFATLPTFNTPVLQTLPHELPPRKAQPPLTRPPRTHPTLPIIIQPHQQPHRQLLPHLPQITSQHLTLIPIPRPLESLVQWKPRLPWQTELFQRDINQLFLRGLRIDPRF